MALTVLQVRKILIALALVAVFGLFAPKASATITASSTTYSTAGTFTYVVSTNACEVVIEAWGAGGAGAITNVNTGGGGGGGGAYARSTTTPAIGSSHTLVVGLGPDANTTTEADSTYDSTTVVADGGEGSGSASAGTEGLASASTGDVKANGGAGGAGNNTGDLGGGGGGAGGPAGAGNPGTQGTGGVPGHGGSGNAGQGGAQQNGVDLSPGAAGNAHPTGGGGGAGGDDESGGAGDGQGGQGGAPGGGGGGGNATAIGNNFKGANGQIKLTEWVNSDGCSSAPTVTTDAATSVAVTSATINGNVTSDGGDTITARGFATSTVSTLSSSVSTSTLSGTTGAFSASYSNSALTGNTTYYFRAYATNALGTSFGLPILSFLTLPDAPGNPTYGSVTSNSMTVSWTAPTGGASTYKLQRCITSTDTCVSTTGISGTSEPVSGLSAGTSYDFAVRGTNATGDGTWSATTTQSTLAAPTVTTQNASSVGKTSATFNGNITATGGANVTVRGFAWGTNSSLSGGDTATTTDTAGQPFSAGAFTDSSQTLFCNTTYYYRPYATNSVGTGYGTISNSFTTTACEPIVSTQSASSVGETSATLNGTIEATGGANADTRGFAWGTLSSLSGGDTATTSQGGSFGVGTFNTSVSLTCNTTYYSRAYATNSGGTGFGAISASFTTSACTPPPPEPRRGIRLFPGLRVKFTAGRIILHQTR